MRNNIVKKIPKDFSNAFVAMTYQEQTDEDLKAVRREVAEEANKEILDFADVEPNPVQVIEEKSDVPVQEVIIEDKKEVKEEILTEAIEENSKELEQNELDLDMVPPHISAKEDTPPWLR